MHFFHIYSFLKTGLRNTCMLVLVCIFLFPSLLFAQETVSPSGTLVTPEGADTGASANNTAVDMGDAGSAGERADERSATPGPEALTGVRPGGTFAPQGNFTPLVGIPGLDFRGVPSDQILSNLIQTLYRLAIVVGALIAVLKITLAGLQYMGTDSIGNKEGAKNDISSALLGLVILLSAVLIMETISGQINLNFLNGAPQVTGSGSPITLSAGSVNPASAEVKSTLGCAQTGSGSGRQCANNLTPVMKNGIVSCEAEGGTASGFGALSQTECQAITQNSPVGSPGAIIVSGGTLYGVQKIARADLTDTKRAELLQACRDQSGNPNATVKFPSAYLPNSKKIDAPNLNVVCSNAPE